MFRANKKLTQSVTFTTEDAADQALWDAVEKELSLTKYQTFSNLCKQALWQFLFAAESPASAPSPTPTATSSSLPPADGEVRRWAERVGELQKQLSHLEEKMLTEEKTRFDSLQRQLTQMTQQLAQLQVAITLQANSSAPQPGLTPPPPPTPAAPTEPTAQEAEPEATPEQQADPVLQRLSSLIDDF